MSCSAAAPTTRPASLLLGRIAVEKGFIGTKELDRCVRLQVGDPFRRGGRFLSPLGEILVARGYLSGKQLAECLDEQRRRLEAPSRRPGRRLEDLLFGRLVVEEGLVSRDAVNAALRLQAVMEELGVAVPRLGELLVERGWLTARQVDAILDRQARAEAS